MGRAYEVLSETEVTSWDVWAARHSFLVIRESSSSDKHARSMKLLFFHKIIISYFLRNQKWDCESFA